nr:hypothetical protein [Nitrosomonas nitrosa]
MQKTKHYIGGQLSFILSGLSNSRLPNDFNDLANKSSLGIDAVKRQVGSVVEKVTQQAKQASLLRLQMPVVLKRQKIMQKRALIK